MRFAASRIVLALALTTAVAATADKPKLTVKANPDPLRSDPVAHVDNSCVGCGVCGEVADAAVLCPSFYRADLLYNPSAWDRMLHAVRAAIIGWLQRGSERRRLRHAL